MKNPADFHRRGFLHRHVEQPACEGTLEVLLSSFGGKILEKLPCDIRL